MRLLAVLILAFVSLRCCLVVEPPPNAEVIPPVVPPVKPPPPGEVVCLNEALAGRAKSEKAAPNVVIVVVYGSAIYGETMVWPDGGSWWMPQEILVKVMRSLYPGRVLWVTTFPMPLLS